MGLKVDGRSHFFDFRNYHRSGGKNASLENYHRNGGKICIMCFTF